MGLSPEVGLLIGEQDELLGGFIRRVKMSSLGI